MKGDLKNMKKEKYIIPLIEVINLSDDIITTSPQSPFDPFIDDDDDTEAWD